MSTRTDAQARAAQPKAGKFTRLLAGGLYLEITKTGRKGWRLKYRYGGMEKRLSFGPYPLVSLKEARQARDNAKRLLIQGIDPSAVRQANKAQAQIDATKSFQHIATEWFERREHPPSAT